MDSALTEGERKYCIHRRHPRRRYDWEFDWRGCRKNCH